MLTLLTLLAQVPPPGELWSFREKLMLSESKAALPFVDTTPPYLPVDILHYSISLDPDVQGDSLRASECRVVFQVLDDTLTGLRLNFVGLVVDSVLLNGSPATYSRQGAGDSSTLVVELGAVSPGQVDTVSVFYHGVPDHSPDWGLGLTISSDWVHVFNEPWGARYWFPCVDVPSEKATSELSILVPPNWRAVSNGVLVDADTSGPGSWFFHWRESYPIATYLVVVAAHDYATLRDTFAWAGDTMPIFHWITHEDSAIAVLKYEILPEILGAYSARYGVYPFMDEKYSHVQVLGAGYGGMENQTNTFLGGRASYHGEYLQAHELAHQWWGDYITCGTWADIWLNEGFATFSEASWAECRYGEDSYDSYIRGMMNGYFNHGHNPPIPIYNPGETLDELFSAEVYNKAGAVLHSLRRITEYLLDGDTAAFWGALRYYRSNHGGSYALTRDFTQEYQAYTGLSLDWFFDEWLYKAGYPVYQVIWSGDSVGPGTWRADVHVEQTQSHAYHVPTFKMPVPITFSTASGETTLVIWDSLDAQDFSFYLAGEPTGLDFDSENWVIDKHTVQTGVAEKPADQAIRLISVGPNPASRDVLLRFTAPAGLEARAWLYRIDGSRAASGRCETSAGVNKLSLGVEGLKPGLYLLRLAVGGEKIFTARIIKL